MVFEASEFKNLLLCCGIHSLFILSSIKQLAIWAQPVSYTIRYVHLYISCTDTHRHLFSHATDCLNTLCHHNKNYNIYHVQ